MPWLHADPVGARWRWRSTTTSPAAPVHLNLDGPTIAKIFLGQITNWNDPAIAKLNPGANLPNLKITPVFRSDGSGTSYNFTDYLSAVSTDWKTKIGVSTQPAFPAGLGAKGNSAASPASSRSTPAAIGYTDIAFAIENHITSRRSRTPPGSSSTRASATSQAAALRSRRFRRTTRCTSSNPPKSAPLAYPIATYTYMIVPPDDSARGRAAEDDLLGADGGPGAAVRGEADRSRRVPVKVVLVAVREDAEDDPHIIRDSQALLAGASPRGGAASFLSRRERAANSQASSGQPLASTSPPAAATTCLTIASPRPVPRVVRAASRAVEALEQTLQRRSIATPTPSSAAVRIAKSPLRRTVERERAP